MSKLAVIAVPDLMFQLRIEAAARALGFDTEVADTPVSARDALARRPAIVIVDLHAIGLDAETVIRGAKAVGTAVLAFGRHTEATTLRAARQAGADLAVARSQLVEELPELIGQITGENVEAPGDGPMG
ncbi:MAG: response regulator transcription factor [Chloroflexi bacterium]|nr:response regulator transcription factor [Chloroflexota bacterium]